MFRSAAFLESWVKVRNASLWSWVQNPTTDTCVTATLQLGCKHGVASRDYYQAQGWGHPPAIGEVPPWDHSLREYRPWPSGDDLMGCWSCLAASRESQCYRQASDAAFPAVVRCVAGRRCPCPALVHSLHEGLCTGRGRLGDKESTSAQTLSTYLVAEAQRNAPFGRRFRECLGLGLCRTSHWHRMLAVGFHSVLLALACMSLLLTVAGRGSAVAFLAISVSSLSMVGALLSAPRMPELAMRSA
uniref:Uncharacterized protein n=1 Tax=Alexandrium monilatum TaxID=311494 RepID=A0A7S4T0I0_9DINO